MREQRHPSWPIPNSTGAVLVFEGSALPLLEVDGLYLLDRGDIEAVLGHKFTRHGHWYTRNFGAWATRVAWVQQPDQEWKSVRLLTLYAAQYMAKRLESPTAGRFVDWAEQQLTSDSAPRQIRVDLWTPPADT